MIAEYTSFVLQQVYKFHRYSSLNSDGNNESLDGKGAAKKGSKKKEKEQS